MTALRQEIERALELRCRCQSDLRITEGGTLLDTLIQKHGISEIEVVSYDYLPLHEFWEFVQLADVFERYDASAHARLRDFGMKSKNQEIIDWITE